MADFVQPDLAVCLWFDGQAETAAQFYVALFGGEIHGISRYGAGAPFPEGTALVVEFSMRGQPMMALNGGPHFNFTEAISLSVSMDTQEELDRIWHGLTQNGGAESQCGWCKDRFGVSWQIVPRQMSAWMKSARAAEVMAAFMPMTKLDIATLARAAHGG
jgi:predicted 3-demethylubiquinone-9 3-methyltransferase (glyoxalase superfamily)